MFAILRKIPTVMKILRIFAALLPLLALSSCMGVYTDPLAPDAIVSDADWQDVSASAGNITRDDVTVTFNSGTFKSGDRVAITPVAAGAVAGIDEASPFYQFTMPESGSSKPVTVSINYSGDPSKVHAVMKTEYYAISLEQDMKATCIMDSTPGSGTIDVTIPETRSTKEGNAVFTVGLVSNGEDGDVSAMALGTKAELNWTFDWNMSSTDKAKYRPIKSQINDYIRKWVPTCQSILMARGFEMPKIYYEIVELGDKPKPTEKEPNPKFIWGYYLTPKFVKTSGHIQLNATGIKKMLDSTTGDDIQTTIIHETVHAVHCIKYDPRLALWENGAAGRFGSEWTMLSEAIAVWSEQFVNNGKALSGAAAEEDNYRRFVKSFFPPEWWVGSDNYQNHGYGMAAFIQWLAKKKGHNSVVRLLELQKAGWTATTTVRKVFDSFLKEKGLKFFDTESYMDFAWMYSNGELVSGVNYSSIEQQVICRSSSSEVLPYHLCGPDVYSYGFLPGWLKYDKALMQAYTDEDLRFEQFTEGLESHVWYKTQSDNFVKVGVTKSGSPLNLSIKEFVEKSPQLVILTITVKSTMTDDATSLRSSLMVSFRQPPVLPKIWTISYSGDHYMSDGSYAFLNEGWTDGSGYSTIKVSEVADGYFVEALQDWYDLSFTITVKDGVWGAAKNVKNVYHLETSYPEYYNFTIPSMPIQGYDSGRDSSYGDAWWEGDHMTLSLKFYPVR